LLEADKQQDNFFREAYGQLVSRLCRMFGVQHLSLIEDVVQDSLLVALDVWKMKGWLYTVARNKTIDALRKEKKKLAIDPLLLSGYTHSLRVAAIEESHSIADDTLRMMFVCCHPAIPKESQVALCLKTLCGFSVKEIAATFLTSEETITKRLYRAREVLRDIKLDATIQDPGWYHVRLESVLLVLYGIFTEGYHATQQDGIIRVDVVEDALRLTYMLACSEKTQSPSTYALLALMCFQAARLTSRVDEAGNFISLSDQDRSYWNKDLIAQGIHYLAASATGNIISTYHLEAGIALEHINATSIEATNWKQIVHYYEQLYARNPSDVILLNMLIAKSFVYGSAYALNIVLTSKISHRLQHYYMYHATLGMWYESLNDFKKAKEHVAIAIQLTKSPSEKRYLEKKMSGL
jgi:RNA polymerase sigma factor (sigma-70 family)